MKKLSSATPFIVLFGAALLTSCLKGEQSISTLQVYYPSYGYRILMADLQTDSLKFYTTESGYVKSSYNWLCVPAGRDTIVNPYANTIVDWHLPVSLQPNLTGQPRSGSLQIVAGSYVAGAYYAQTRCLGITRPTRFYDTSTLLDSTAVLTDSATHTVDSITFTLYSDWTISVKDTSWLTVTKLEGRKGVHTIPITFDKNLTTADRYNVIYLHSQTGINDSIPFKQLGKTNN